jgi:hypothetical protein
MSTSGKSSFLSFSDLLYEKKVGVEIVRFAIEWYGVYVNDGSVGSINNNFPDGSEVAKSAIALLDRFESSVVLGPTALPRSVFDEKGGNVVGWFEREFGDFIELIKEEKNKNFRTLYYLLTKSKPINRSALIDEIESNGIFFSMKNGKSFHVNRDSSMVAASIQAIAQSVDSAHRQADLGYMEPCIVEHPAIFEYGWPSDQLPEFRPLGLSTWFYGANLMRNLASLYKDDLYTVGRIFIVQEVKPADMKKVIESQGICGFDEYGDLKKFSFDDEALSKFRDSLKKYSSILIKGNSPSLTFFDEESFCRFGWPREELPDFSSKLQSLPKSTQDSIKKSEKVENASEHSRVHPRSENSYRSTIGAMLMYIEGSANNQPHQDYEYQSDLVNTIAHQLKLEGVSESYLEKMFADVRKFMKERHGIDMPAKKKPK